MKKIVILFMLLPFCMHMGLAQSHFDRWSDNTAGLINKGNWELALAQPVKYGLSEKTELQTTIFFPLYPMLGVKISEGEINKWQIASRHSVGYPTLMLNLFKTAGIGGLISPEFADFPAIFDLKNEILASAYLREKTLFTASLMMQISISKVKPDALATIDFPLVYPEHASFYKGIRLQPAADIKSEISEQLIWEENIRVDFITRSDNNFFIANRGNLLWITGKTLAIKAGYVLSYGDYPFGNHWQLWPAVDLIFNLQKK